MDILLVDSNPDVLDVFADILDEAGHRVTVSHAGTPAVRLCCDETFDLIILEWILPDITGPELAPLLTALQPSAELVVCSACPQVVNEPDTVLGEGVCQVLSKPCGLHDLMRVVELHSHAA